MGRKGARRRIGKGVYEDQTGISAVYRDRAGKQREVRFPAGTTISKVREGVEARKKTDGSRPGAVAGTLAHHVEQWDETHLASWRERRAELRAWTELYGRKNLTAITRIDVQAGINQWLAAGVAPKTVRNRLWSLRHLFRLVLGSKAETPCDDVKPPRKVKTLPGWVSPDVILAVYERLIKNEGDGFLRSAKTRARFMVQASTGRRPSEIMRAQYDDVDLDRRVWRVRDGKGGWTPGGLPLNDDMVKAWEVFIAANAWGPYNTGSFARALRFAGWPAGVRPYSLRHSAGIDMSEAGIDLQDVGAALGHTTVQTTRSAYVPILNSRMRRASESLHGRLKGWTVEPPAAEPLARGNGTSGNSNDANE